MSKPKINLASDNCSPAHPRIMQAIIDANDDAAASYGGDDWTLEAEKLIQKTFKAPCKIYIIPTGTGSNVFALMLACRRYESVICTDIAHINFQETGAFEAMVGAKLLGVKHKNGKLNPQDVKEKLHHERAFGRHSTSPRVISITQPTEVGTVYSLDELRALATLCRDENLLLHIDGSRLYNAAVFLGCDLHKIIDASKADLLSLGGTKNGLVGAEALLIFNPAILAGSDYLQKQSLQLMSKMRYLSAQFLPFFKDDLWRELALNANQKAKDIGAIIENLPGFSLNYPVESNQIFFTVPKHLMTEIEAKISCLPWNLQHHQIRFLASWNTSDDDVKKVGEILQAIARR